MSKEYCKFVLNILCVTLFVMSSVAAFEAAIPVKTNVDDEIMTENHKLFYINLHLKDGFRNGIHSLLSAYRYFVGQAVICVTKYVTENI